MMPSDITNKALRDTYYVVQDIIAARYEKALKQAADKESRRALTDDFEREIRDTIAYYVNLLTH